MRPHAMCITLALVFAGLPLVLPEPLRIAVVVNSVIAPALSGATAPCTYPTNDTCLGGVARTAAWLRQSRREHPNHVTVGFADDLSTFVQFHPSGYAINNAAFARINVSCWSVLSSTIFTTAVDTVPFLHNLTAPLAFANIDLAPWNPAFEVPVREVILTAGPLKVGLTILMQTDRADLSLVSLRPTLAASVSLLRGFRNVNAVIVVLVMTLLDGSAESLVSGLSVDAIICVNPRGTVRGPLLTLQDTTAIVYTYDRAASVPHLLFLDLEIRANQSNVTAFQRQNLTELLPASLQDADYFADSEWLRGEVALASRSDPVVGESTSAFPSGLMADRSAAHCRTQECEIGNLWTDALYNAFPHGDIALYNGGAFRTGWAAGTIHLTDLYAAVPFTDYVCVGVMTGLELYKLFNYTLAILPSDLGALTVGVGRFPQIRGARMWLNPPTYIGKSRIVSIDVFNRTTNSWHKIDRFANYTIVTTRYLCSGGDGVPIPQAKFGVTSANVHSIARTYIANESPVSPLMENRTSWKVGLENDPLVLLPVMQVDCHPGTFYDSRVECCLSCPVGTTQPLAGMSYCTVPEVKASRRGWILLLVLVLVVGVLLLGLVIAAVCFWRLSANYRRLRRMYSNENVAQECAVAIAKLDFEAVAFLHQIPKPNTVQRSFLQIVAMMKEFRKFMTPAFLQALQEDTLVEEFEDDADCEPTPVPESPEQSVTHSSTPPPPLLPVIPPPARKRSLSTNSHSTSLSAIPLPGHGRTKPNQHGLRLLWTRRRAAYLKLTLLNTESFSETTEAEFFYQVLVATVHPLIVAEGGVIEMVAGTFLSAHWGCTSLVPSALNRAAKAALKISSALSELRNTNHRYENLQAAIVLAFGTCISGSVSTDRFGSFIITGEPVRGVHAFLTAETLVASQKIGPLSVLTDDVSAEALNTGFALRPLRVYSGEERWYVQWVLVEAHNEVPTDEWMYELDRHRQALRPVESAYKLTVENLSKAQSRSGLRFVAIENVRRYVQETPGDDLAAGILATLEKALVESNAKPTSTHAPAKPF